MIRLSWYQCDVSQKCNCLLITSYQEVNRVGMFFSQFKCCLSLFVTYIANIFFLSVCQLSFTLFTGFFVMKSFKFLYDQIYPICVTSWFWMKVILSTDVKEEFTMFLPSTCMTNGNSLVLGHLLKQCICVPAWKFYLYIL